MRPYLSDRPAQTLIRTGSSIFDYWLNSLKFYIKQRVCGWCIISALTGYSDDSAGSGELDDGKEADQNLMMNSALQKTVYIASTVEPPYSYLSHLLLDFQ